ncbi:MAG: protein kinase domain-containing protein [Thermoanaerobaculia bacterium]
MKPDPSADPERWQRIEDLLDEMFERPASERHAFLDQACAGEPEIRAYLEALLKADEQAGDFLATPAHEAAAALLADPTGEAALFVGLELGPYRLIREIGAGGMGVVYEAEDSRLRRRVAVKLLLPEYSRDRAAKERFLREARAASALDDPNICTIHDVGEHDSRLYIVMALYEGETLKERLARGPLPVAEARQVAVQVARALARAHEAGIVHRDIKPANVMLARRGDVKVLDFGIAKMKGDSTLTRTGSSPGTPAYMSPEQARGEPVDGRTDLWALGVMLYEMLAGRRPFPGDDEGMILAAVRGREPEPLDRLRPEVPPELARTVEKALAKNPRERYANAAELLEDLGSGLPPGRRRWRRKALRTGLLAGGAIAAAVLLAFLLKGFFQRAPVVPALPTLKVAVLHPIVASAGNDPEVAFVASELTEATLAALISLEGVEPLDPPEKDEERETERLRRSEVDEAVRPRINCRGEVCQVTLHRLPGPKNVILATVSFEVETGIESSYQLAEAVRINLLRLYSDRRSRPGSSGGKIRPQDYSEYTGLQRLAATKRLGTQELSQLDFLIQTSPDLLGAYCLAADIARGLPDIDRAIVYASRAGALTPNDPRPLFSRFRAEMAGRRLDAAKVTLGRLAAMIPGDARVPTAEADLLEARDELKEAHRLREQVARRRPAWRHVLELASLEFRLGESDSARRRLAELLAVQPTNQYVRENIALVETAFGDPARAVKLYEELVRLRPEQARSYLTNIGFVLYVLGDYATAEKVDRRALALEHGHTLTRFNLATALEAQGKLSEARQLYRALAGELETTPKTFDGRNPMLHTQCLVRLARRDEATRLADEVLKRVPEDFQSLHQAAQIYALLGEYPEAIYYTKRALKTGLIRDWFTIPEFNSLKKDKAFLDLLNTAAVSKRSAMP